LRAIRYLELAENVRDMIAHRLERQAQVVSNLLVALTLRYQGQEFGFSVAQFGEDAWGGRLESGEETQ
jgi:hypothetical protein